MKSDADSRTQTWPQTDLRAHLERILVSKSMARSESLGNFLRFVVEETLAGRNQRLKARVIAVDALGKAKNFDPRTDPIVSIQAGRLRRALKDFYEHEGRNETIRIELPKGSYQPSFQQAAAPFTARDSERSLFASTGPTVAVVPLVDLDVKKTTTTLQSDSRRNLWQR